MLKSIHFDRENLVQLFTKKFLIVILISIPSAIIADFFNIPLAWMIGPMISTSLIALKGLARDADMFALISDQAAEGAMPVLSNNGLETTPSGGAGLAALLSGFPDINQNSRVLCIVSEESDT